MTDHRLEDVTLSASRLKWISIGLISLLFVVGGIFMLITAEDKSISWIIIAFFGLGLVVSLIQLIKPGTLTLTQDGFEQSVMGRKLNCKWQDVSNFGVTRIQRNKFVSFSHRKENGNVKSSMLSDTFGMKAKNLAVLMSQYRDQAVKR